MTWRPSWATVFSEAGFLLTAIVVSYYFNQLRFGVVGIIPEANLDLLLAGNAQLPIQYRALVPWIVKIGLDLIEITAVHLSVSPVSMFQAIEFISSLLLVVVFRSYIALFVSSATIARVLAFSVLFPLIFQHVLWRPANPLAYLQWFAWDIPSIVFITAGLILLYKHKWFSYYVLFLIASFNRETTCFLTFIYLFTELGRSRPNVIGFHCILQLFIWAVVKYALYLMYMGNMIEGGSDYFSRGLFFAAEFYDGRNLATMTNIRLYPFLFGVIGYLWIPVVLGIPLLRDHFVKRSLLVVFPFYVGMFYVGAMTELRNFGELIPVVLMAFLLILLELFRLGVSVSNHLRGPATRFPAHN